MNNLTQQEANSLLAMDKFYVGTEEFNFPTLGGNLRLPLFSSDDHEEFSLDITRGYIALEKNTFQTRARKAIILARLDLAGPPHRNPDDQEIACPHLHLYREGYGDKWAMPLPNELTNIDDIFDLLHAFMDYCKIIGKPKIFMQKGLSDAG